jgi:RNA polymerase sigma-32 factor
MHDAKILSERLNEALNELTPRERLIIFRRRLNDEGATLEQLGGALGVSKERVRQLEHRALKKLRVSLEAQTDMPLDLLPQLS